MIIALLIGLIFIIGLFFSASTKKDAFKYGCLIIFILLIVIAAGIFSLLLLL